MSIHKEDIPKKGYRFAEKKDFHTGSELHGIGWDGKFQKGIVDDNYIIFENEYGGVKSWHEPVWNAPAYHYHTVYSDLYVKL